MSGQTVYALCYLGHDGRIAVARDDAGVVPVWATQDLAEVAAAELVASRAVLACLPVERTPEQMRALDLEPEQVVVIEATAFSEHDAEAQTHEAVRRIAGRIRRTLRADT